MLPIGVLNQTRGFITRWTVGAGQSITLPLVASYSYNCTVDWGDGTPLSTVLSYNSANATHTYTNAGTYNVEIRGTCEGWSFNSSGDNLKIVQVVYWGDATRFNGFKYLENGFYGCSNLTSLGIGKILVSGAGPTSLMACFQGCALTAIPAGLLDNLTSVTTLRYCFAYNHLTSIPNKFLDKVTLTTDMYACFFSNPLTTIPSGLLDHLSSLVILSDAFGSNALTSIPTGLFDYNPSLTSIDGTFYTNNLAAIPAGLLDHNPLVWNLSYAFASNQLTSIPSGLFDHLTSLTNLRGCFYNNSITAIPTGLLNQTTLVSDMSSCFYSNNLTSIPSGLFDHLTSLTTLGSCFYNNNITSLPSGLFDHLTSLTSLSNCFNGNNLSTVPAGLLDNTTAVTNLSAWLANNNNLLTLPPNLFRNVTAAINFSACFSPDTSLQVASDTFYSAGEETTRFLNKTVDFTNCYYRTSSTCAQGTAPDLWTCNFGETITLSTAPATDWVAGDTITGQTSGATALVVSKVSSLVYKIKQHFGAFTHGETVGVTGVPAKLAAQDGSHPTFSGTPISTACFGGGGNSLTSLSNYASIPASWK